MSRRVWMAVFASLALTSAPVVAGDARQGRTIPEIIRDEPYRSSWAGLVANVGKADRWLLEPNGPAGRSRVVMVAGAFYEVADVCKTHDCAGNRFVAMFGDGGKTVVGLLAHRSSRSFLGAPGELQQKALTTALPSP